VFGEPDIGLRVPVMEPVSVAKIPQGKDKMGRNVAKWLRHIERL
jgi:hypothetical protein